MDARPPLIAVGSLIVIRPERNYDDSFETVRDGCGGVRDPAVVAGGQGHIRLRGHRHVTAPRDPGERQVLLDGLRLVPAQADARAFDHSALCARLAAW